MSRILAFGVCFDPLSFIFGPFSRDRLSFAWVIIISILFVLYRAAQALWEAEHPPAPKPEPVREPTPEPVVVVALAPEPEPVEEDEPEPVATAPVMMEATTREPAPEGSSLFNNIAKRVS